jgi:hypothetical protein
MKEIKDVCKSKLRNKSFRAILFFIFLGGVTFQIQAQQQKDSLRTTVSDSLSGKINSKIAALNKEDSIKAVLHHRRDSIQKLTSAPSQKLDVVKGKVLSRLDSINSKGNVSTTVKADSLQPKSKALADIRNKSDSISGNIQGKTDSLQSKVNSVAESAGNTIQKQIDKVDIDKSALSEAGISDVKLPYTNLPDANVPGVNLPGAGSTDLPGANLPGVNTPAAKTGIPTMPSTDLNLPAADIHHPADQKLNTPSLGIPDIEKKLDTKEITGDVEKQIDAAGEGAAEIKEQIGEVKQLKEKGVEDIDATELSGQAEERIAEVSEVQTVQRNMGVVTEKQKAYEAMVAKYKNKKLVAADMKRKMANVVNDQINMKTPQVKQAQEAMAKQKHMRGKSAEIKGIVKKKENILGSKPFGQRLIPGITLQTTRREDFMVDFGLQTGYRLTERLAAGIGLTYALGFNKSYDYYVRGLDIYGTRAYGDFLVINGFFVHGELTWGHHRNYIVTNQESRAYNTCGFNTGIGKQFNLSKRVKGTMLALYRVEIQGHLPQQSKINVRFGFDLYPKRKRKQPVGNQPIGK